MDRYALEKYVEELELNERELMEQLNEVSEHLIQKSRLVDKLRHENHLLRTTEPDQVPLLTAQVTQLTDTLSYQNEQFKAAQDKLALQNQQIQYVFFMSLLLENCRRYSSKKRTTTKTKTTPTPRWST